MLRAELAHCEGSNTSRSPESQIATSSAWRLVIISSALKITCPPALANFLTQISSSTPFAWKSSTVWIVCAEVQSWITRAIQGDTCSSPHTIKQRALSQTPLLAGPEPLELQTIPKRLRNYLPPHARA